MARGTSYTVDLASHPSISSKWSHSLSGPATAGSPGNTRVRQARELGLEGIVSDRAGSQCWSGNSRQWLQPKNPAFDRDEACRDVSDHGRSPSSPWTSSASNASLAIRPEAIASGSRRWPHARAGKTLSAMRRARLTDRLLYAASLRRSADRTPCCCSRSVQLRNNWKFCDLTDLTLEYH